MGRGWSVVEESRLAEASESCGWRGCMILTRGVACSSWASVRRAGLRVDVDCAELEEAPRLSVSDGGYSSRIGLLVKGSGSDMELILEMRVLVLVVVLLRLSLVSISFTFPFARFTVRWSSKSCARRFNVRPRGASMAVGEVGGRDWPMLVSLSDRRH